MLVVFTTHSAHRPLSVQLARHIQEVGGVQNHDCLIVCPVGTDLSEIEGPLRNAFRQFSVSTYHAAMSGWPYGPNELIGHAMNVIYRDPMLVYHYLILEPDCVPVTPEWVDAIDRDYRRSGKEVLGVTVDTVEIATGRKVGRHCVGVAVYPKDFARRCPLVRNVTAMSAEFLRQKSMPMPWDAYFGAYTNRMTAETALIQHIPRRRMQNPDGSVYWDIPTADALAAVRRDAVLVHGPKDLLFLQQLTGKAYATPTRKSEHPIELVRDAPRETVRESEAAPREEGGRPNGVGGEPIGQQSVRKRKEEPLPFVTTYARGTPEFKRVCALFPLKWKELRQYAIANLRISCKWKTRDALTDEIVAVEKQQMKEPWTAVFSTPPETPIATPQAVKSPISYAHGQSDESAEISPAMREKMLALQRSRQIA